MKRFLQLLPALALLSVVSDCFSQPITTPRPASPAAQVSQTIGISKVTVAYSRPSLKGRKVWGALVPYGWNVQGFGNGASAPWRAGANENTTISFSHSAKVEGVAVPAGTYGLFFVVNQDNSGEVILSKNSRSWGSFFYDKNEDQMKAAIKLLDNPASVEMLTYDFINLTKNAATLVLNWEKKSFPVKIEFAVDDIVMANAKEELRGPVSFTAQGFTSAANYALANNTNVEQGLAWIDQLLANGFAPTFAVYNTKSGLLQKQGKTAEAEAALKEGLAIANENDINNYGYQLLGQQQVDKAIEMFVLNTQKNPKSANAWDSLGEGYATKGDKENAIKSFKKSLGLNPAANVKANSEKFLKQLGAM